ncbi:MAG: DEAD/DEAH box helicase family protein, partial [Myxococcales bacterium]|nr:DEAD/DEAH box helicase family protein [Myxococcales bacterium]
RELTINELASFHESVGGRLERTTMFERLHAADWCFDNQDEQTLVPLKDYITGDLWPRHDLAARLAKTSAQWMLQFERLRGALKLATWTDIAEDASPTQGWVPIDLLSEWMSETQNEKYGAIELVYREGLYQFKNVQYADTDYDANISWQAVLVLGWLNHDNVLFAPGAMPPRINRDLKKPKVGDSDEDKDNIHDFRRQWDWYLSDSFRRWVDSEDERRAQFVEAYNRNYRGYVKRDFVPDPLEIARWGDTITLHSYQVEGVRRLLANRGGLLAYDVGLGKTYTGIAFIARAKQEGWARRPVVVVPGSLAFKWLESFQTALPDYRVIVIGATRIKRRSGPEVKKARERLAAGELTQEQFDAIVSTSRSDTVAEQAEKWIAFMSGAYDAVILTRDALPRT